MKHTENTERRNNCSGRWLRFGTGEPLRIGCSNIPIREYPDENGDAKGFVNEIAVGILKKMSTRTSSPSQPTGGHVNSSTEKVRPRCRQPENHLGNV